MEGGGVYDDSHMANVLLKNERLPCSSEVLDSLWAPKSSPSFNVCDGELSIICYDCSVSRLCIHGELRRCSVENNTEKPFFTQIDCKSENCSDDYDGCFHQPEKKRRLSPDQVQFLEKSFEVENKLEPERKVQLAKELGLQPRQVAIWFQNRRARFKSKVLEKEYDSLKASYDKLKLDYDNLFKENEKMKNEVDLLTEKLKGQRKQEQCDPISPSDLQPKEQNLSEDFTANVAVMDCKQEDGASSVKSDVFDSDSPLHYTDGNHSASLEPANSSHVFESEFSQDEDDSLSRGFLPTTCFPKLEIECFDDLQPNSCNLGFPVQDQGTWFWQY